jgi:hypothetical protein
MVPEEGDPIAAAEALIAAGRAHEAALGLRARLAEGRGGALARATLVKALLASNDVEGALAEAREAVSLNPGLPLLLVSLGEALLAAENLPAAIAELQRAPLRAFSPAAPGLRRARRTRRWRFSRAWIRQCRVWRGGKRGPKRSGARRGPIRAMCVICSTNSPPNMTRACAGSSPMRRRRFWARWPTA